MHCCVDHFTTAFRVPLHTSPAFMFIDGRHKCIVTKLITTTDTVYRQYTDNALRNYYFKTTSLCTSLSLRFRIGGHDTEGGEKVILSKKTEG